MPGFFEDCLILADDFRQYYLGAYVRASVGGPQGVIGIAEPIAGYEGSFGGPVAEGDNPLDEAGFFQPTSDVLPVAQFPQFAAGVPPTTRPAGATRSSSRRASATPGPCTPTTPTCA